MKWLFILGLQGLWIWAFKASLYQAVTVSILVTILLTLDEILDVIKYKLDSIQKRIDDTDEDEEEDY